MDRAGRPPPIRVHRGVFEGTVHVSWSGKCMEFILRATIVQCIEIARRLATPQGTTFSEIRSSDRVLPCLQVLKMYGDRGIQL